MLSKKVVVIMGGAGLIGRTFVEAVAKNNGISIIADMKEDAVVKIKRDLFSRHSNLLIDGYEVDITKKESLQRLIHTLHEKYGRIDALVNCAYPRNQNFGRRFEDVTYEDFSENLSLHLGGYFLASQQFSAYFLTQGYGNVVSLSSVYGMVAPRFRIYSGTKMTVAVEYAAIKSALIHLTKYMATYHKGKKIRFNCISPGGILDNQPDTFLTKYNELCLNKGMLDTKDLTGTLLYLLSDLSEFVNGQTIAVDDGFTL